MNTCATCRWSQPQLESYDGIIELRCHRHAPNRREDGAAVWPPVCTDHSCGDHEPRTLNFKSVGHEAWPGAIEDAKKLESDCRDARRIRRLTLLEASTEVAGHWNDKSATCNQYQQAQRSAAVLQRMALEVRE